MDQPATREESLPSDAPTETTMHSGKDLWDKVGIVGTAAIPIVVALLGWFFSATLKSREVDAEYVNLAIQVLQNRDTAEVSSQLRLWAGDILDEMSPVPMPTGLREAIAGGTVTLPLESSGPGVARLDIELEPNMMVTLDDARRNGPGVSGWVTRVQAGPHDIVWLSSDSTRVCSYSRVFEADENVRLRCDRQTGVVAAEIGLMSN